MLPSTPKCPTPANRQPGMPHVPCHGQQVHVRLSSHHCPGMATLSSCPIIFCRRHCNVACSCSTASTVSVCHCLHMPMPQQNTVACHWEKGSLSQQARVIPSCHLLLLLLLRLLPCQPPLPLHASPPGPVPLLLEYMWVVPSIRGLLVEEKAHGKYHMNAEYSAFIRHHMPVSQHRSKMPSPGAHAVICVLGNMMRQVTKA